MNAATLVGIFFAASFVGWIVDTAVRSIEDRRYSRGGFSWLPLCPIYGFGFLIVWITTPILQDLWTPVRIALLALLLTMFEYLSARFSEFVFGRRLWNYSKRRWNIQGRIELWHSIAWGVLGYLSQVVIIPAIEHILF